MFNLENNLNKKYFGLLAIIMIIYTGILVYCQNIRGINYWDIFVYLQNAMLFSNVNIGSQLSLPPVLSILTSILFRLGYVNELSLFIVCGILFIFLVLGIYLLFNEKFDCNISLIASLIFSMFSLIVSWAVTGATDVPALSFAVWALLFTVYGLKRDFKYYYFAILLFILAFFTRFTEGFILIVMGFYIIINFEEFKRQLTRKRCIYLISFILCLGLIISSSYIISEGSIPFISQFIEVSSSSQVSSINVGYELNPWYYIQNMPEYLTSFHVSDSYFISNSTSDNTPTFLSYGILLLLLIYLCNFCGSALKFKDNITHFNIKTIGLFLLSLFIISTYTHLSYLITEILFTIALLLYYKWFEKNDKKMDYIMILWIGIYIIMHSYHPVKVDRYIIPILVPITYCMTESLQYLLKEKRKIIIALLIILVIMIPINTSYILSITQENQHSSEEKTASEWLKQYDSNLERYNLSSDRGVVFSWYLKKYVYTTIPRVLDANNESLVEKLDSIEAKYYIDSTSNTTNITGYNCIYDNQKETRIKIYEREIK